MAKLIIEGDSKKLQRALLAEDMTSILWSLQNNLQHHVNTWMCENPRDVEEISAGESITVEDTLTIVSIVIGTMLRDRGIDLDSIWD